MAIITSYFAGETYGMLGPQMAATIIQGHTAFECIVIAVTRDDDKLAIKKALADYFHNQRPIIGFSTLSGREDLFSLARELKEEGATTILAGPQADRDFVGEVEWERYPYRFHGLADCFSFAVHGPAEQAMGVFDLLEKKEWRNAYGLLFADNLNRVIQAEEKAWDETYLHSVRWDNLYRVGENGLQRLNISTGQVLQQIGCPYAGHENRVAIDYPVSINDWEGRRVEISLRGCSFCDVASDKGFYGELDMETVLDQIRCLPGDEDGRKIAFELINENPLHGLPRLLERVNNDDLLLSRINLILRADWLIGGEERLRDALKSAQEMGISILASSVGFEAFDDRLLRNFHKGLTVDTNIRAIQLMRRLKESFPDVWHYSREEGAIHGFIHPTPWDTHETYVNTQKNISIYGLSRDILPPHSTPLIIHHASALGDWIREVEKRENFHFKRYGSIIGWWDNPLEFYS
ncbi:MAG: hypothetical protein JW932_01350 [Deltaproteobacteria bacterium]|nr:hypothetical protein [Deltaproteobacteria bacterium]